MMEAWAEGAGGRKSGEGYEGVGEAMGHGERVAMVGSVGGAAR